MQIEHRERDDAIWIYNETSNPDEPKWIVCTRDGLIKGSRVTVTKRNGVTSVVTIVKKLRLSHSGEALYAVKRNR